ncbi:MAG: hypothetical protein ABI571_07745 [Actinomycetota bacterium]
MTERSSGKGKGRKPSGRTVGKSTKQAAKSASTGTGTSRKASVKSKATARRKTTSRHLFVVGEEERLDRLVEGFGNNRVAALLEVSQSQPSRWRRGEEKLSPDSKRRVLDIDYVISRLLQVYPREQAEIWLTSSNAHLGGRPIDVLHLKGVTPVIEAIDAEAEGAFA